MAVTLSQAPYFVPQNPWNRDTEIGKTQVADFLPASELKTGHFCQSNHSHESLRLRWLTGHPDAALSWYTDA